jgi:HEAT repeat protein
MSDISEIEQMKRRGDIQGLIEALRNLGRPPSNRVTFNEAVKSLGEIGNGTAVSFLVEEIVKESVSGERHDIAEALRKINDPTTVPAISKKLRSGDETKRRRAIHSLSAIGDRAAIPTLVKVLNDESSGLRYCVAEVLGELGDKTAVPALIEALQDEEKSVSWTAAKSLGELGDKTAVPALIEALQDQSEPQNESELVRCLAAEALGKIGDTTSVPSLIHALEDKRKIVRENTAEALGELGDDTAVPALAEALKDNEENVSWIAAKALGKIGEAAVSVLVEAQNDARWEVRHNASEVLSNRNRRYSPQNLPKIAGKAAVPTLIGALNDEQWSVRYNAAYILGEIGDKRAVKPLQDLRDHDEAASTAAREALKKIEAMPSSTVFESIVNFCRNCGSKLTEGGTYCSRCGHKV